jgi:Flp pilus assembly protein TadG
MGTILRSQEVAIRTAERLLRRRAKGQALVLVGVLVSFGVLLGLVALAADGGSAVLQRRNMQNGANAASLAAAQTLAASVVLSGNVGYYLRTNGDITARIDALLAGNRGGTTGSASYKTTLYYGTFTGGTPAYAFVQVATSDNGPWVYQGAFSASQYVPPSVDAVQVDASLDNPTTFARVVGIDTINVAAKAAAALKGDSSIVLAGPTWPMTSDFTVFTTSIGLCNPAPFYLDYPSSGARFENLISLAALQGRSQGQTPTPVPVGPGTPAVPTPVPLPTHAQLLSLHDERTSSDGLDDNFTASRFGGRSNQSLCGSSFWVPSGNCSSHGHGDRCCRGSANDVSDIDIRNWIYYDFTFEGNAPLTGGKVSTTANRWRDDGKRTNPLDQDWRSSDWPPDDEDRGDWLETYLSTNAVAPAQVVRPLKARIPVGQNDDLLSSIYGSYVDRVMYLYDRKEILRYTGTRYEWQPAGGQEPDRVRIVKAMRFRFYNNLANEFGFSFPLHASCGSGLTFDSPTAAVYGIAVGQVLDKAPATLAAHGLNNYVGFIDPGE